MTLHHDESLGQIDISPNVVVSIATQAINQCYGVVGMARATQGRVEGLAGRLSRQPHPGLHVAIEPDGLTIDVYVIVQYGVRIRIVAESIQNTVKFHLEKALGVPVLAVNVYIQGLRRQDQDDSQDEAA